MKTFNDVKKHLESCGKRDGIECALSVMIGRGQMHIALVIYDNYCKVNGIESRPFYDVIVPAIQVH